MKTRQRLALALALVLMTCGLIGGFTAWTIGLNILQPAGPAGSPTITFTVRQGETTNEVADDLVAKKIITNALAFRLWSRYKGLDQNLQPGTYELSASMTIPKIVEVFLQNVQSENTVTIPEGFRILQIAKLFADKSPQHKLSSDEFIQIAQTGSYTDTDGKTVELSSEYWFLNHDQQADTDPKLALEGFLFPDTYRIAANTTAADVIHKMLDNFAKHLCPGPSNQPNAYFSDEQQCEANAVKDDTTQQSIFDLLKKSYTDADGTSMADKLFHALTLASIVEREARTDDGRQGVTSVYYNRYLVSKGELKAPEFGLNQMQADPTVQYALGTPDEPWPKLTKPGKDYDVGAYNTYHNPGLPPGPICSPGASALSQSFSPEDSPYFYFIYGKDQKNHYARTLAEQNANIAQYGVG